ncbi:hypothetical protein IQ22_00383 [Pseudomonas duriflava]|uniref:histidine kinase n=1 Tax=Pseudomonas duriflava TaxID=459528 RepID=A0A562QPQ0_9PSED|nr:PAS domain S-box protein [Pseudomonas duriflava]TWI58675.1 hypothetical protein IQ22_00383 [Pseudomonas duriflava]
MKERHIIVQAYLYLLAFSLLTIGGICLANFYRIDQPTLHVVVLPPDSSLLCLLLGTMLLAIMRAPGNVLKALAVLLIIFCTYSLAHNFIMGGVDVGVSWITGFRRIRSALALTMLVWVLAIFLCQGNMVARRIGQLLGLVIVLIGCFSQFLLLNPDLDGFRLGFKKMSSVANIYIALLGIAVILLGSLSKKPSTSLDRLTLAIGFGGALISSLGCYLLSQKDIDSASKRSDILLSHVQSTVRKDLDSHVQLINRMAERWQSISRIPRIDLLQNEVQGYLRDFPALEGIAVVGPQREPYWLQARKPVVREWLETFLTDPLEADWLQHVIDEGTPHISQLHYYESSQHYDAFIVVPMLLSNQPGWFLVASIDVGHILKTRISNDISSGFIVRVYEGESLLYESEEQTQQPFIVVGERELHLHEGIEWRLVSSLNVSPSLVDLPALALLFGLSLSFCLMISQRLGWLALERSKSLEASLAYQARMQKLHQKIMEFTYDVLCSIDAEGRFQELSPSCYRVLGYKPEEMVGRFYREFLLPEDQEKTEQELSSITPQHPTRFFRNRYRHRQGNIVHILWTTAWSNTEKTFFAVGHDITRLVKSEEFTDAQRRILRMISLREPLNEILSEVCCMVEAQDTQSICSILLADSEETHLIHGAAPSLPESYIKAISGLCIGPKAGSCGTAAFRREAVYVENIEADPLWDDFRESALKSGLKACWSIPLINSEGKILGTFAMYRRQAYKPNEEQLQLLTTAEQLAAIAIERSQSLQRMEESEQRFRSLFTFNPDPVFSLDLEGNFQNINEATLKLTELSRDSIIKAHYSTVVTERDLARVTACFQAASQGMNQHYETHIITPRGEILLDVTNQPIIINNRIAGVFGIAKDITERKAILKQLQQKNLLLSMAGHTAKLGGWALVLPEQYMIWSEEVRNLLEFPPDVIPIWNDILPLHPEPFRSRAEEAMRLCIEQGEHMAYDIEIHTALGRLIHARITAQPVRDDDGKIVRVVGSFQDISDRKRGEQQLQATLSELERSNRELEEFAYVASHDLQEPLRKIQAFSERLTARTAGLDEEASDYLKRMNSAASRMQALVIDLLNYSRVNTRGQVFQRVEFSNVVEEVLDDMEATIEQTGARIECHELPTVMGDPTQLRQVIQNLISNALKFQVIGTAPVVKIYSEQTTGDTWKLCIADNGIGFDEKYLDRIFNPFQRLHSRESYAGTGIGLAIVKKIVERHHAFITAKSSPGEGSTFRITFPRSDREEL